MAREWEDGGRVWEDAPQRQWEDAPAPVEEERAQPGTASYIAQGPLAAAETAVRMMGSMAGAGAGALIGGAEALLTDQARPAADIIRERMTQGAELPTKVTEAAIDRPTVFAPTGIMEEYLGKGMEAARDVISTGVEGMEAIRGKLSPVPATDKTLAAAKTLGEYAFDAPAAVAPYQIARGMVRRPPPRPAAQPTLTPETPSQPAPPAGFHPQDIVDRTIKSVEENRRMGEPQPEAVLYEVPDPAVATPRPVETATTDAVRQFQREGAVTEPITETQRLQRETSDAIRAFRNRQAKSENFFFDERISEAPPVKAEPLDPAYQVVIRQLEEHFKANDTAKVLDAIARDGTLPIYRDIAKQLQRLGETFKPTLIWDDKPYPFTSTVGQYKAGPNTVTVKKFGHEQSLESIAVHELAHAATFSIQLAAKNLPHHFGDKGSPLTLAQLKAARRVDDIYVSVRDAWEKKNRGRDIRSPYGFRDPYEFLAEAESNPHFQKFLKRQRVPTYLARHYPPGLRGKIRNMWDYVVDTIRQMLGLPEKSYNALRATLTASSELMAVSTKQAREYFKDQIESITPTTEAKAAAEPVRPVSGRTKFEEYEDLPKGLGKYVPDLVRPLDNVVKETIEIGKDVSREKGREMFVKLATDMRSITKYWLNPEHIAEFVADKLPIVKAMVDRVIDKKRFWAGAREDFIKGGEFAWDKMSFMQKARVFVGRGGTALRYVKREREGAIGLVEKLRQQGQMDFFNARIKYDNAEFLEAEGRMWPTREEMARDGFNKDVIDAYMRETEVVDALYNLTNWARKIGGKDPIPRIPGYMPHMTRGHWGVKIMRVVRDIEGKVGEFPVAFKKTGGSRSNVAKIAEDAIAEFKSKHEEPVELRAQIDRTDTSPSFIELVDAMETTGQMFTNMDKPAVRLMHKMLDKRIASLEQQFLQHQLKRTGLSGWIGEYGATKSNLKELLRARMNWIEGTFKFAESQDIYYSIQDKISSKSWNELVSRLPNTADYITKFLDVARDKVPLNQFDKTWLGFFHELTGDRFSYKAPLVGLNKLRGFFSIKDLAWSWSYHMTNAIQPEMIGTTALNRLYSQTGKGDPITAILKAEHQQFAPTLENKKAIEWAAKNKVITPRLMEEIDFMTRDEISGVKAGAKEYGKQIVTGRRLSEMNEAIGRLRTFLMGLEYFRSTGMKESHALNAAAKFTDNVMVDYSTSGLPLWLASNPLGTTAGRAFSQYAAFRHSFWGHTILAMQAIKKNPGMARKVLPLIQLQLATLTFAGIRGMAFFAEATALVTAFNAMWETLLDEPGPLPNPMAILLASRVGQSDAAVFGALSASTKTIPGLESGVDIGQTAASPQATEAITARPLTGFVESTKAIFQILAGDRTDSEQVAALKAIVPNYLHGWIEMAYSQDAHMSFDEHNRMRGNVLRSPEDWRARRLSGKRSLAEQRQLLSKNIIQREEARLNKTKSQLTEVAADFFQEHGYFLEEHIEAAEEQGYSSLQFQDRVKDLVDERHQTRLQSMTETKRRTRTRERLRERVDELLQGSPY